MDSKLVVILVLSLVIIGISVFGIVTYKDLQTEKDQKPIDDFQLQETRYKNESSKQVLGNAENGGESDHKFFRAKHKDYYHTDKYYNNKDLERAMLLYETGEYQRAFNRFIDLKVETYKPEASAMAYYHIASCLVKMDRHKKARNFLFRIIKNLRPTSWTTKAVILLGKINRRYQFSDETLEMYLHKLHMESADPQQQNEILTQLGYLKLFRNELDDAMDQFQKSNTVLSRLGQARVFVRKNMYWKAISIYEDMLEHKNFNNEMYFKDVKHAFLKQTYYYAKRWLKEGDYDHAYFYMRKIVNFFPNSIQGEASLFWIGEIFYRRKIYSTALKYYNLALSNGNRNKDADAQFKKGVTYFYMKKYGAAMRHFKKVLNFHKNSGYIDKARHWLNMVEREVVYRQ